MEFFHSELRSSEKKNGVEDSSVKKPQSTFSTEFVQIHFSDFIITIHREQVQLYSYCCWWADFKSELPKDIYVYM